MPGRPGQPYAPETAWTSDAAQTNPDIQPRDAALYRKRVPVADLDLERARVVNLDERTELRPWLKSNGMSMPGFQAGHFRLRGDFGKAFCLLTQRERVLSLPLRDGKAQLLLSLEQPQALLGALRATGA